IVPMRIGPSLCVASSNGQHVKTARLLARAGTQKTLQIGVAVIAACACLLNVTPSRAAPGDIFNLGTIDGTFSEGYAINASGQIGGQSSIGPGNTNHAFRYIGVPGNGGTIQDLGALDAQDSSGWAINNAGQVAGNSDIGTTTHAFLYTGAPGS